MSDIADLNLRWAWRLLDGLVAAGLRRLVLSPGSRSTPLALAALRHPRMTTEVMIDERSAAFFALGLAQASGLPVALAATSGSAVANWWPAVVEADMARVPLVLLSADRPPELQDCGANQTMDQIGLFGRHVRFFSQLPPAEADADWLHALAARCFAASLSPLAGPVHINVPLREPLVATTTALPAPQPTLPSHLTAKARASVETLATVAQLTATGGGAIICGPEDLGAEFRREVGRLAQRLGAPIFADLLSGLRFARELGPELLAHPDQVARHAPRPAWLLRFGPAPVSKALNQWLSRCRGCPQIVIAGHGRLQDPQATASHVLSADPAAFCAELQDVAAAPGWLEPFSRLDGVAAAKAAALGAGAALFEGAIVRQVLQALPGGSHVFLGNSLAVRSAEWFAGRRPVDVRFFGNRGVSGIDGSISTAFGIAAEAGSALAVVGDLAFLHDVNALLLGRRHALVILLLDNGGGGIFDHLPQADLPEFERGWLTPQSFDAAALASGFGIGYVRAQTSADAVSAIVAALAAKACCLVHVRIQRDESLARSREFHSTDPLNESQGAFHEPVYD